MKELSIEEKAKYYDKAKINGSRLWECGEITRANYEYIFSELKEPDDERIRKELIKLLRNLFNNYSYFIKEPFYTECITWIEKQGEQKAICNEDADILQRFSFYSYKDEPNILYLSGLYVNEECRNKGIGTKILEVADEVAKSLNCHTIRLKTKKDSNAERLYRTHGYNSLATEESDEIWLEKKKEELLSEDGKRFLCFPIISQDEYKLSQDEYKLVEQKIADKIEPKFREGDSIQYKGFGHNKYTIKEVCGLSHYINTMGARMDMSYTDANFELIVPSTDNDIKEALRTEYEKGRADAITEFQKEWNEEDEKMLKYFNELLDYAFKSWSKFGGKAISALDWLISLKERYTWKPNLLSDIINSCDKGEFSQFEYSLIHFAMACSNENMTSKGIHCYAQTSLNEAKKEIKFTEEDEKTIHLACEFIRHHTNTKDSIGGIDCSVLIERLKSLIPQTIWKPSELQIEALESATENCAYSEYQDCLRELIEQLKKLM